MHDYRQGYLAHPRRNRQPDIRMAPFGHEVQSRLKGIAALIPVEITTWGCFGLGIDRSSSLVLVGPR